MWPVIALAWSKTQSSFLRATVAVDRHAPVYSSGAKIWDNPAFSGDFGDDLFWVWAQATISLEYYSYWRGYSGSWTTLHERRINLFELIALLPSCSSGNVEISGALGLSMCVETGALRFGGTIRLDSLGTFLLPESTVPITWGLAPTQDMAYSGYGYWQNLGALAKSQIEESSGRQLYPPSPLPADYPASEAYCPQLSGPAGPPTPYWYLTLALCQPLFIYMPRRSCLDGDLTNCLWITQR